MKSSEASVVCLDTVDGDLPHLSLWLSISQVYQLWNYLNLPFVCTYICTVMESMYIDDQCTSRLFPVGTVKLMLY